MEDSPVDDVVATTTSDDVDTFEEMKETFRENNPPETGQVQAQAQAHAHYHSFEKHRIRPTSRRLNTIPNPTPDKTTTHENPAHQPETQVNTKQDGDISKKGGIGAENGLKLRLELNLDVELELKAKIRGDLTISLL